MRAASNVRPSRPRALRRAATSAFAAALLLVPVACGKDAGSELTSDKTTTTALSNNGQQPPTSGDTTSPDGDSTTTTAPPIDVFKGMPPVVDPSNIYSEAGADKMNPATEGALSRVYVPNEVSGTLTVIDPATRKVINTYTVGVIPQHVVPAYDMKTLYVLNNSSNSIVPVDPLTGVPGKPITVDDPYNLYFTPDGSEAIIVAEAKQRLDFADPKTFKVHKQLQLDCDGLNHLDYSIDGKYLIATCEFEGTLVKIDIENKTVVGAPLKLDITPSGKANPIKKITQPQDIRVANDGHVFYVADLITDGVYIVDGDTFTQQGFVKTGVAAHGLYPSRDGQKLYVVNRGTNSIPAPGSFKGKADGSIAVLDFKTRQVEATWPMDHGSPDMGNLTADGSQLWLGGRYDAEVYVFDTREGKLIDRIPAGQNPHGLTVWPQPGRFSFGHTGNMR